MIKSNLVMKYVRSFKDIDNVYFLLEYVRGETLDDVIFREDIGNQYFN